MKRLLIFTTVLAVLLVAVLPVSAKGSPGNQGEPPNWTPGPGPHGCDAETATLGTSDMPGPPDHCPGRPNFPIPPNWPHPGK